MASQKYLNNTGVRSKNTLLYVLTILTQLFFFAQNECVHAQQMPAQTLESLWIQMKYFSIPDGWHDLTCSTSHIQMQISSNHTHTHTSQVCADFMNLSLNLHLGLEISYLAMMPGATHANSSTQRHTSINGLSRITCAA